MRRRKRKKQRQKKKKKKRRGKRKVGPHQAKGRTLCYTIFTATHPPTSLLSPTVAFLTFFKSDFTSEPNQ